MKERPKIDLGMTGYDELFMNDQERAENRLPKIYDIPLSEIDEFPDHPFKVKDDEDMLQLVESVRERGIITPITLRRKEDGRYEIVSGHRRKRACEIAGLETIPAEIKELSRDEAIILMVESNLQRSVMKNHIKKGMSGLLAFLMCFTVLLSAGVTPAFAASETCTTYSVGFPRDGDANQVYSNEVWGHPSLTHMNGWHSNDVDLTTLHCMNSYDGQICYCIEPAVEREMGETMSGFGEDFWDNYPSNLNNTIQPDDIKVLLGRIMQYGYHGTLSTAWRSQNSADADKIAHAYATQILVWETVVGERDANFNHVSTGSYDPIKAVLRSGHPLYSRINSYYDSIVASVQNHTKIPSFILKNLQQINNNMNQIAVKANAKGFVDTASYWENVRWLKETVIKLMEVMYP